MSRDAVPVFNPLPQIASSTGGRPALRGAKFAQGYRTPQHVTSSLTFILAGKFREFDGRMIDMLAGNWP
jgi:hypothetical protein